jgi:hypothetical protein
MKKLEDYNFYIVNTMDRPAPHLIAYEEAGMLHYTNQDCKPLSMEEATNLIDFGFTYTIDEPTATLYLKLTNESKATYRNKKPRNWQGDEFITIKLHKGKPKVILP